MKKERQTRRVKSAYPALLITEDGREHSGTIENISLTGLFLSCQHNLIESAVGDAGDLFLLPKNPRMKKKVRIVRLLEYGIALEPLT
jgi:hypothetical protein